jgi:hypothetical protein
VVQTRREWDALGDRTAWHEDYLGTRYGTELRVTGSSFQQSICLQRGDGVPGAVQRLVFTRSLVLPACAIAAAPTRFNPPGTASS